MAAAAKPIPTISNPLNSCIPLGSPKWMIRFTADASVTANPIHNQNDCGNLLIGQNGVSTRQNRSALTLWPRIQRNRIPHARTPVANPATMPKFV